MAIFAAAVEADLLLSLPIYSYLLFMLLFIGRVHQYDIQQGHRQVINDTVKSSMEGYKQLLNEV